MGFGQSDFEADTGGQDNYEIGARANFENRDVQAGQNNLLQSLQQQSQGTGPNAAMNMLNQQTDQNIQQNAGMIASQKGINPALAQRLAAQNQAGMSQQAAAQGATMQAQQSQNAINNMGNIYNQQGQNAQQSLATMQSGLNSANSANAQISAANAQSSGQMMGGAMAGAAALMLLSKGGMGEGKALVSPGEKIISPDGSMEKVPGKAKVKGDSVQNDTVIRDLKEGSVVVPRSSADNDENTLNFLKHMKQSSGDKSEFQTLLDSHKELRKRLDALNKNLGKLVS